MFSKIIQKDIILVIPESAKFYQTLNPKKFNSEVEKKVRKNLKDNFNISKVNFYHAKQTRLQYIEILNKVKFRIKVTRKKRGKNTFL